MRWKGRRQSSNVDDRRRLRLGKKAKGGGIGAIVVALAAIYFGVDPSVVLNLAQGLQGTSESTSSKPLSAQEQQMGEFVSVVLADTEDAWHALFKGMNKRYQEPRLVLFTGSVKSACGFARAAMGPFYCPSDQKVYIDLSFYRDLKVRHKAPGDFAQAYVVAHEVGHHVQTLLGISSKVRQAKAKLSKADGNKLSVKQELQADCFAGIWAHHTERAKRFIEEGDIEEALTAASAIGDDRLQKQSRGYVTPESFTHGSSKQRVRWFRLGLKQGSIAKCNTFKARSL
ncbi:MAG: flagellar biosynthesis protein FlgM [Gammaproteobacteria bacterium]|nr:flagellar biosynthesis protein FlgM [Gammaproteobacteria bacterium]